MMISDLVIRLILVLDTIFLPLMMHQHPHITSDAALSKAVAYLEGEFNDEVGLIRESPDPRGEDDDQYWVYWLMTDNRVAQYALKAADENELASNIADTLQTYKNEDTEHGIIEVLNGENIAIPPLAEKQKEVVVIGDTHIWTENRNGNTMNDWEEYADLLLYGSLDAFHNGDVFTATIRYEQAMDMFDGTGFVDRFFCDDIRHQHPTYKLALTLYTAHVIGRHEPQEVLKALLAQQDNGEDGSGGFYTLYDVYGKSVGNTSTEPTAFAILAFSARK